VPEKCGISFGFITIMFIRGASMKMSRRNVAGLLAGILILGGCAGSVKPGGAWQTLIDGNSGLTNFNPIGDANWRAEGGAIVADRGKGGFLVSKQSYKDFQIRSEFWADDTTNSGIFIRMSDPTTVNPQNSYEVNIYDRRPDPTYSTGGIVDVGKVPGTLKAAGKWNTMEITARGTRLIIVFNGVETVNVEDSKHAEGQFALQFGAPPEGMAPGSIKWRKVEVRAL
jgi:Domain of Unknown Function (DUF1080)